VVLFVSIAAAVATAALIVHAARDQARAQEVGHDHAREVTRRAALELGQLLGRDVREARQLAIDVVGADDQDEVDAQLAGIVERSPWVSSATVTWRPEVVGADGPLRVATFAVEHNGRLDVHDLGYEYTAEVPSNDWYHAGMASEPGVGLWTEPYRDEQLGSLMVTYSEPIRGDDGEALGVVTLDYTARDLAQLTASLDLGLGGFPALVTRDGTYLYHPRQEYWTEGRTLTEVGELKSDVDRIWMAEAARIGATEVRAHRSTTTDRMSWLAVAPVPISGWSLQNTFLQADLLGSLPMEMIGDESVVAGASSGPERRWSILDRLRRTWVLVVAAAALLAIALATLALRRRDGRFGGRWSATVSVLGCVACGTIWTLAPGLTGFGFSSGRFAEATEGAEGAQGIQLPTGVMVESIQIADYGALQLSGQIWQRHSLVGPQVARDVRIAGARDVGVELIGCVRRQGGGWTPCPEDELGGRPLLAEHHADPLPAKDPPAPEQEEEATWREEVVLYSFQATVDQSIRPSQYPLDQERLAVPLLHPDPRVDLAPDMSGYEVGVPSATPGLAPNVAPRGWTVTATHFERRPMVAETATSLGKPHQPPSLFFQLQIRRKTLDAFIYSLVPLVVVAWLLFALVMVMRPRTGEAEDEQSVGPGESLGLTGALALVVVFAHLDLRQRILADGLVYLEAFYLVLYAALIWVSVLALRYARGLGIVALGFDLGDHRLSRVMFWPVMILMVFAATAVVFY